MSDDPNTSVPPEQPASGHDPNEGGGADELRQIKRAKLEELRASGLDPYAQVRYDRTHSAAQVVEGFEALEGQAVAVAGRVMARRVHGKAGFADLQDESGRVQLYFKKDVIGDDSFERYTSLDLGDILGARGTMFRTRTGQVSVEITDWVLLVKTLQTLPEKFHGLTDVEQRYRQRYIDLIMNRESLERAQQRGRAVSSIRHYLDALGFLEVETPMLHAIAGGATAEPFVTHWNALKADYYLRIAIELHLKRLIVGGLEKVYEIGRVFRNEGVSTRHNPEFTMLELYWAYVDYTDIMQLTEDLVVHLADNVFGTRHVQYGENTLDLTPPFARLKFDDALRQYAGVSLSELGNLEQVRAAAQRIGVKLDPGKGFEAALDEIFKEKVEPNLVQPTFIYDYPKGLSPLAKSHPDNPELCYRFELFMAHMEIANSFSELNDPVEQRERFDSQIQDRLGEFIRRSPEMGAKPGQMSPSEADAVRQRLAHAVDALSRLMVAHLNNALIRREVRADIDVAAIPELLYQAYNARNVDFDAPVLQTVTALRPMLETIVGHYEDWKELAVIGRALDDTRLDIRLDEDFLTALEFGMPPTGGLGIGIDRLMMMLSGTEAIREVILFPQLRQR